MPDWTVLTRPRGREPEHWPVLPRSAASQILDLGLAPHSGGRLDAPQRPPESAEIRYLVLLLVAPDVGHGRRRASATSGVYTTNAIDALNSSLRGAVKTRGHFPNDTAATKLFYLALLKVQRKLTRATKGWSATLNQFAIYSEGRLPE